MTTAADGWDSAPTLERQPRILVVEDDRALCETIATVLQADGFAVETAPDGRLAIEKLETSTVIMADVRMPGLDGPGLYRELARRWPALLRRIVFTTGDILSEDVRRFLETSGGARLDKPFDIEDLRRVIRHVVEMSATR